MYSCPECEQLINQASEVCPYCGADQKALADTELLLAGKAPKPAKTNYKRVAVVCGILLATLWAIAWFAVSGRDPAGDQRVPTERRQRPTVARDSRRRRPQSRAICATSPLHSAIHARPARSQWPHHRLHAHRPRWKFRLPQLLHRRIRHRARHRRRPRCDGARPAAKSSTVNSVRPDSRRFKFHNFSRRRKTEVCRPEPMPADEASTFRV
jgi:hypothetical protein